MLKTILALSKQAFKTLLVNKGIDDSNVEAQSKVAFISINETQIDSTNSLITEVNEPPFDENHSNVLILYFDDTSTPVPILGGTGMASPMNPDQALETIKFIKKNEDKELFIIHCGAGISRSGAIATFLNDYFNQNYESFKRMNPSIHASSHVLNLLRRAKEAYDTLYPPIQNASITIYPDDKSSTNRTETTA